MSAPRGAASTGTTRGATQAEVAQQKAAPPGGMLWRFLVPLVIGVAIWFIPPPEGVDSKAWHLLAIFVFTIAAIIAKPLPMGAVAIIGIALTALTGTLDIEESLSGFANPTIWLIVLAFFI